MGYDISYHPVDVGFFHNELFPIIRGERPGDELFARAARIAKVRYIANAYGLAVSSVHSDEVRARVTSEPSVPVSATKPTLMQRLLGRASNKPPAAASAPTSLVGNFDSDLHLWGRPFFIVADGPPQVSELIDHYLAADETEAAAIARDMVRSINPALLDGARAAGPKSLTFEDHLTSNLKDLPDDAQFATQACWKIMLFRDCYQALGSGRRVKDDDGNEHDPDELFATDFASAALEFASLIRPGWMDRGKVWPTLLMSKAGLDPSRFFESPQPIFQPLMKRIPQIGSKLNTTITENYMLGGYVPPDDVAGLIRKLNEKLPELKAVYDKDEPEPVPIYLRKQLEALQDAASRNMGFLEATEIYSGPLGTMN